MTARVLHSFPHKIGAARICDTAWHEVVGVDEAGGRQTVYTGVVHRPLPAGVEVHTTLARGRWRIPYRVLGHDRALRLHDRIVARALPGLRDRIDVVHTWPLAGLETLRTARELGLPTVVERPNAHTRFAYGAVQEECLRLGVELPSNQEHSYNVTRLRREELEYELGDYLLCPSDFVVRTFLDQGFAPEKLLRHVYGYDPHVYHPAARPDRGSQGLRALFVGVCAVRKGLHYALEAWLRSPACETGTFRIAGEFLPAYEDRLAEMLAHPSVEVLGHRNDVPELMRDSDILLLPSIEEGFGLVCVEAMACGCVPVVSNACTELCVDGRNAFVHEVADVEAIAAQLTTLESDRERLAALREACLADAPELTWRAAGTRLLDAYEQAIAGGVRGVPGRLSPAPA
ncbi:MAG TPA: glycosyltransferase family 4 protein [Solirubrobacteraceae bacterium]|nr:glycosyltransferase family 4 protein [Solirubrobacteraceae bacterium]